MADPIETGGEAVSEPSGTTEIATDGQSAGQSAATVQTTVNGTGTGGESFFDYELIKGKPELEAAYKEMQGAFSRKTQAMSSGRDKITQYDQFMQNPVDTMRQLAQQYGYQMVQGDVKADDGQPKTFNNWEEVFEYADKRAEDRLMAKMQPMIGELQNVKKQNVEQSLDNAHPDWRTYEDSMMENLRAHPTLVNNPDFLYRMSVPAEVLEARANKRALAKIQGATESGTIQGQSATTKQATKAPGKMTFDQAVSYARQEVNRRGIAAPRGD